MDFLINGAHEICIWVVIFQSYIVVEPSIQILSRHASWFEEQRFFLFLFLEMKEYVDSIPFSLIFNSIHV